MLGWIATSILLNDSKSPTLTDLGVEGHCACKGHFGIGASGDHKKDAVNSQNITGRRIRALREELAWSQEKLGVAIGIDKSSARARISRYELGVHEPPLPTGRLIADALNVPLSYLYCEDHRVALLLLKLHRLDAEQRSVKLDRFLLELATG